MKLLKSKTGKIDILGKIYYKRMSGIYKNRGFSRIAQLEFEYQGFNAQGKCIQDTGHEVKENDWREEPEPKAGLG